MANVPKRVAERLQSTVKQFQAILASAKARDINEADTVTIIKDMLSDVFGYDKYTEITSEYAIRGNYCDLAIKLDNAIATLIEVKAIGIDLKENHIRQAVDYAANQGVDWVLLTNGICWKVYRIHFTKPIEQELVVELDFSAISHRADRDLELLHLWCKEGWVKSALGDYHTQKQALSRYFLGAVVLSDTVVEVVRRELRRLSPDVRIDVEEIRKVLSEEVIKREVLEGERADQARKKATRAANVALRTPSQKDKSKATPSPEPTAKNDA